MSPSQILCISALLLSASACSKPSGRPVPPERQAAPSEESRPQPAPDLHPSGSPAGGPGRAAGTQPGPSEAPSTPGGAASPGAAGAESAPSPDPRLLHPESLTETAPARFTVELDTTKGPIRIDVTRAWAPIGADRFYNMVRVGYYTDVAFFRVIEGFMAQVGIHGDPRVNAAWRGASIRDDPATQSNTRGMVTFAKTMMPNSRNQQVFINFGDNSNLDSMGFAPFGRVQSESMAVVDRLYSGYGEGAPSGRGPVQARFQAEGNAYLHAEFARLDYVRSARIVQ